MGHVHNNDRNYRLLQQRLDRTLTGAPESPVFIKILQLLFSPAEAELARKLPGAPTPVDKIATRLSLPEEELADQLRELARRGVVVDLEHDGVKYFALPPVVIGFFEFTFMRTREDMPMRQLAELFDAYMRADDRFARSVFSGETQLARSLVHEEAVSGDAQTEILDWERAAHIIASASSVALSLCACRHKTQHLGKPCGHPLESCISLNRAADMIVRVGMGRRMKADDALRVLQDCKARGLAQTADNVQQGVSYICNCCGCCCGMMEAVRTFDIRNAVMTSNWIASVDTGRCTGCGNCARACPVGAIAPGPAEQPGKAHAPVVPDTTLCLGCGVCHAACKKGAVAMRARPQRVQTPETMFDQMVAMAIERGKLHTFIFDNPEKLSHRALGRALQVIEMSPPVKALLAIRPLRSAFMEQLVKKAKKSVNI